jgi:elongation factor 1 alpha-like protein
VYIDTKLCKIAVYALQIRFVPVSGLSGDNVVDRSTTAAPQLSQWYSGPTFLQCIDAFTAAPRLVLKPLRLICTDVSTTGKGVLVSGRITQGRLQVGDRVLVMPLGDIATVQKLDKGGASSQTSRAGDAVEVLLTGVDASRVAVGSCVCKAKTPIPVAYKIEAQVSTLDALSVPLIRYMQCITYIYIYITIK